MLGEAEKMGMTNM